MKVNDTIAITGPNNEDRLGVVVGMDDRTITVLFQGARLDFSAVTGAQISLFYINWKRTAELQDQEQK